MTHELLLPVLGRLNWAGEQAAGISRDLVRWADTVVAKGRTDMYPRNMGFRVVLESLEAAVPLDDFRWRTLDCVHNLRASLDNLAFALARRRQDPPAKPKAIAFPICETPTEFLKAADRQLSQLDPAAVAIIETMQLYHEPFTGPLSWSPLALLSRLNNADKHQVPPFSAIHAHRGDVELSVRFQNEADIEHYLSGSSMTFFTGRMVPGAVLMDFPTKHPIREIEHQHEWRMAPRMELDGEMLDIGTTLQRLHAYCVTVLTRLEPFF